MKLLDEKKENRVLSCNRLSVLCSHIKLEAKKLPEEDVKELLEKVDECASWVRENLGEEETQYNLKHEDLYTVAAKVMSQIKSSAKIRSPHIDRMKNISDSMTANYCFKEGNAFLDGCTKLDLTKAAKCFQKAYTIGYQKSHIGHIVQALKGLGHTKQLLTAMEDDKQEKTMLCVEAAIALNRAMEEDRGIILRKADRITLIKDLQLVSEQFFKSIDGLHDTTKLICIRNYMQCLDARFINSSGCIKTVFKATLAEIKLYLQAIKTCITSKDFKTALGFIAELTASQDRANRLADDGQDDKKVADLRKQIDSSYQVARGMQELELAKDALNGEGDLVDMALISLDHIHTAKYYTHGHDNKTYCKAKLMEGRIFFTTIQNKLKAKTCFETIVKNSAAKNLHIEEFSEAKFFLEKLEAEAEKVKKPDVSKDMN